MFSILICSSFFFFGCKFFFVPDDPSAGPILRRIETPLFFFPKLVSGLGLPQQEKKTENDEKKKQIFKNKQKIKKKMKIIKNNEKQ